MVAGKEINSRRNGTDIDCSTMDIPALVSENVAPYSSRFIHHSQSKISTTANSTNKPTDETIIQDYHKKLQTLSFILNH
jgi:hypothetical protein